jgi:hypothetical protein
MNAANIYAGGLIGKCAGGIVTVENCYYDGRVSASAKQFNVTEAAVSSILSKVLPDTGDILGDELRDEIVGSLIPGDTSVMTH